MFAFPHSASPLLLCEIKINIGPEMFPACRREDGAFISHSLHVKKDWTPLLQLTSSRVDAIQLVTRDQQCLLISTISTEVIYKARENLWGSIHTMLHAPLSPVSGTPGICLCTVPLHPQTVINLNLVLSLLRLDTATAFLSHWFFCPCGFKAKGWVLLTGWALWQGSFAT